MICPAVRVRLGKPPTVAAVSSAQRKAYQSPTCSVSARPTAPRNSSHATARPSTRDAPHEDRQLAMRGRAGAFGHAVQQAVEVRHGSRSYTAPTGDLQRRLAWRHARGHHCPHPPPPRSRACPDADARAGLLALAGCGSAAKSAGTCSAKSSTAALVSIGAGLQGPAGLQARVYAKGPARTAAFAFDPRGRLWLTAAGLETHAEDGVYLIAKPGAPALEGRLRARRPARPGVVSRTGCTSPRSDASTSSAASTEGASRSTPRSSTARPPAPRTTCS